MDDTTRQEIQAFGLSTYSMLTAVSITRDYVSHLFLSHVMNQHKDDPACIEWDVIAKEWVDPKDLLKWLNNVFPPKDTTAKRQHPLPELSPENVLLYGRQYIAVALSTSDVATRALYHVLPSRSVDKDHLVTVGRDLTRYAQEVLFPEHGFFREWLRSKYFENPEIVPVISDPVQSAYHTLGLNGSCSGTMAPVHVGHFFPVFLNFAQQQVVAGNPIMPAGINEIPHHELTRVAVVMMGTLKDFNENDNHSLSTLTEMTGMHCITVCIPTRTKLLHLLEAVATSECMTTYNEIIRSELTHQTQKTYAALLLIQDVQFIGNHICVYIPQL